MRDTLRVPRWDRYPEYRVMWDAPDTHSGYLESSYFIDMWRSTTIFLVSLQIYIYIYI